jgi:hypothetical protein
MDKIAHTDTLDLAAALWWFIENVTDEDPQRTETFFHLRERVRNSQPARAVIVMEGGLVQGVFADVELNVVKIDYDTDGCDEDDDVVELQDVGNDGELEEGSGEAFICDFPVDVLPGYVATRFKQCEEFSRE